MIVSNPIVRSPSSEQGPFPPACVFVESNAALPPASESVGGTSRRGVVGIPILFTTVVRAKGVQREDPTGACQLVLCNSSPGAGNVAKWYSQDITDQRAVLHSDELLWVDTVLNE
jgi:hypothetical protein